MKRVLYILGGCVAVVVLAVFVLWLIGGQTFTNVAEVTIDAPADSVFVHLTDDEKLTKWIDGVTEMEPLTEGGHRVGAKSRIVVEEDGNEFEMTSEVVETEQDRLLVVRITSSMFEVNSRYELTQRDNATHVTHTMTANYFGAARLIALIMGNSIQEKLDADFQRLKKQVEQKDK